MRESTLGEIDLPAHSTKRSASMAVDGNDKSSSSKPADDSRVKHPSHHGPKKRPKDKRSSKQTPLATKTPSVSNKAIDGKMTRGSVTVVPQDDLSATVVRSNVHAFNAHTMTNTVYGADWVDEEPGSKVLVIRPQPELLIDDGLSLDGNNIKQVKMAAKAKEDQEVPSNPSGATELEISPILDTPTSSNPVMTPNEPHPSLEFPPLYFTIKRWPWLLQAIKSLYVLRWKASYPLQQRVIGSRFMRKFGIFCTWGELLLIFPFLAFIAICMVWSFVYPSVSVTGKVSRFPLIFAFATAMHNSYLTLLLGMPFERALWYHKIAGRATFINGIFHTYVAFFYNSEHASAHRVKRNIHDFLPFTLGDTCNLSGTLILMLMTVMLITSLPFVRRKVFEFFYYSHIAFAAAMATCAFFHSGLMVPVIVALTWGVDLVIRKLIMATTRYPRKAKTRIISSTVIELRFTKMKGFDFNPGQFVFIAVPELGLFDWHPFSISSSPGQKIVTLHIRRVGGWTRALYDLAQTKEEISILLEGPFGNIGVDLMSKRYSMILLVSGGIGITPMQSICNQLIYEHSSSSRTLKKLSFLWMERDPLVMSDVDVVRRSSEIHRLSSGDFQDDNFISMMNEIAQIDIASTILSLAKPNVETDFGSEDGHIGIGSDAVSHLSDDNGWGDCNLKGKLFVDDDSFLHAAYNNPKRSVKNSINQVLDIQVYLTDKNVHTGLGHLPFVFEGRPNLKTKFLRLREEALAAGEQRIAVCVCVPASIVRIIMDCCVEFSDHRVQFDLYADTFS